MNSTTNTLRTRMAPSPTGKLHIGTAHTTLFNILLARKHHGKFILRLDDTDQARNKAEFEQNLVEGLQWLGLEWDEGFDIGGPYTPYRQSARTQVYQHYIDQLLEAGSAYRCFCTQDELTLEKEASKNRGDKVYHYSGKCLSLTSEQIANKLQKKLPFVIRMRTDLTNTVTVDDQIRGQIKVNASDFGDFIMVRSDGSPLLVLTTTIDDIEMEITHAIRGEDMLNTTFRQAFIFSALQQPMPKYAHKPFMYSAQGKKLSKRDGATAIDEFKEQGYLPQAILNYLFFVGYTPADDAKQLWTLEEMIQDFNFSHFQKSMPKFDYKKLQWYNSQYIKQLPDTQLAELLKPFLPDTVSDQLINQLAPLVKPRLSLLSEITTLASFIWEPGIKTPDSGWKQQAPEHLQAAHQVITDLQSWELETLNQNLIDLVAQNDWHTGHFFMNLRLAVSGQKVTPPINESIILIGREKVLHRMEQSIKQL